MTVGRELRLRQALKPVRDQYDVILIDCPPALNMLTVNALVAADSVLVPMQCEYYALEGLSALVGTIEQIRASVNPDLEIEGVLRPTQCEYYALEGLSSLLETVKQVRNTVNPGLNIEGLLRTMFDPRNNLSNEVSAQLLQHFGDKVFRTIIPRNVRLAEAPSFGKPALLHDKDSRGALAYLALAGEMIRREEEEAQQAAAAATPVAAVAVSGPGPKPVNGPGTATAPTAAPVPAQAGPAGAAGAEDDAGANGSRVEGGDAAAAGSGGAATPA